MKDTQTMTRTSVALGIIALVVCVIVGYVVIDSQGHDPSGLINFAIFVIPVLIVQVYLGNHHSQQNEALAEQTNGKLTARLQAQTDEIKAYVDTKFQTRPRESISIRQNYPPTEGTDSEVSDTNTTGNIGATADSL